MQFVKDTALLHPTCLAARSFCPEADFDLVQAAKQKPCGQGWKPRPAQQHRWLRPSNKPGIGACNERSFPICCFSVLVFTYFSQSMRKRGGFRPLFPRILYLKTFFNERHPNVQAVLCLPEISGTRIFIHLNGDFSCPRQWV